MIFFQKNTVQTTPQTKQFKHWVNTAFKYLPQKITIKSLNIRIVDADESARLNQTFRKKTGPTNVLSFPADAIPGFAKETLGDVVICAPLVLQEAKEQKKLLLSHWAHLTIHGTLHLIGYDHQTKHQAQEMESLEIKILEVLGFNNPYV